MLLIFILYFFFAATFIIAKAVLQYSAPLAFVGIRMILAGIVLLTYMYIFDHKNLRFKKEDVKIFAILATLHIYIPYVFEFLALEYLSAAKTSLLFCLSPFITAIFAYLLFSEKINFRKKIGLIIGFLSFLPTIFSQSPLERLAGEVWKISIPELLIISAVISSSLAWIIIKEVMQKKNLSLIILNGTAMLFGGILSLLTSFVFESWQPLPIYDFKNFAYLVVLLIIIGNIFCYNLYGALLKKYTATFLSFCGFLTPIFTAILQWFIFKEPIGCDFLITTFFLLIGLYIFYQEELRHGINKS